MYNNGCPSDGLTMPPVYIGMADDWQRRMSKMRS